MVTDDDVDDFLAHFGVKGMKWGKRKAAAQRSTKSAFRSRGRSEKGDKKRKAAVVGGAAAGWVIGGRAFSPLTMRMPITGLALTGTTAVLGGKFAAEAVDRHRDKKVSELKK